MTSSPSAGPLRFDGRVALVTGAGRGMGRAHAELLAGRGARVVVSDAGVGLFGDGSDPAPAHDTAEAIRSAGGAAVAHVADLSTEVGARGAVRSALDAYGRIDIVVHNAGFTSGGVAFEHDSNERLDKQLAINTRAAFALANEAWPHMTAQRHGRIVLAGSTGIYGMSRSVAYCTAKASYIGLARSLAAAGRALGITANVIEPAGATRMAENLAESAFRTWFLATMKPALVSPLVAALVHDDCHVSGESFVVGGGRIARTVLAETNGYVDAALTPEGVLDHLPGVLAERASFEPRDTDASLAFAASLLGHAPEARVAVVAGDADTHDPADRSRP